MTKTDMAKVIIAALYDRPIDSIGETRKVKKLAKLKKNILKIHYDGAMKFFKNK